MSDRRAIAVVLARGGSKGLPRKNAMMIAGRPCVAWTLEAAKSSAHIARVVLSTDDAELMAIGRAFEVEVVPRPNELASDTATVDAAVRSAVEALERGAPWPARMPIVILYGNVPVRPAGLIDRAVALLIESGCDSVQSYQPVGKHHPWWTARVSSEGHVSPWEGEVLNHGVFRRQDLPPAFIPDGGVIAVTREALFREVAGVQPGPHAFFGKDRRGVVNPEGSVVDIDSRIDMLVAEAVLSEANREEERGGWWSEPNRERERAGQDPAIPVRDREGAALDVSAKKFPLAYLITFRTYGTWLHSDARTSVDRHHNTPGQPPIEPDELLEIESARRMKAPPVELPSPARQVVSRTVEEVCRHRGWTLLAQNVRTNHVHLVVSAECEPERIMNDLKSWASRRLSEAGLAPGPVVWSRHGSTRYIWDRDDADDACDYVRDQQDLPWTPGTHRPGTAP
ncbi:MAG: NTP transferase domain-containing protein [Phycisphaerales bacterium]|nr:NTP transferase domain-containing protein [Phycisphaerales bacterium]